MAPSILIQGMRRSGTTILYDALLEDPELRCFYEPWREDTETPGGGSDARESDPFTETARAAQGVPRRALPRSRPRRLQPAAARAIRRSSSVPRCRSTAPASSAPCSRATGRRWSRRRASTTSWRRFAPRPRRLGAGPRGPRSPRRRRLDDDGARPQAGRLLLDRRCLLRRARAAQALVEPASSRRSCSSAAEYAHLRRARRTSCGSCSSGSSPSSAPGARGACCSAITTSCSATRSCAPTRSPRSPKVYRAAGRPTPPAVAAWAREKVKPPEAPYAATDPRWGEGFAALGMREALEDAGYPMLADSAADARAPSRLSGLMGRARGRMARRNGK